MDVYGWSPPAAVRAQLLDVSHRQNKFSAPNCGQLQLPRSAPPSQKHVGSAAQRDLELILLPSCSISTDTR